MCCGNWCKMTSMYPFCHCVFDYCLGNLATSESPVYKIVSLNSSIANSNVTTGEEKCLPDVSNTKIQKHIFHLSTGHTHLFIVLMHLCQKKGYHSLYWNGLSFCSFVDDLENNDRILQRPYYMSRSITWILQK